MTSVAALWTSWQAGSDPRRPGAPLLAGPSGALPAGVPFLPNELGGARLVVEAAFGANLADTTEASWTWYDISADVHFDPGIRISPMGRQDASQSAPPAECTFELDNTNNRYTPFNPLATYWPNIKEGTPIRVRVIISGVSYTRFQGRAIGFNPTPDSTGYHQMITVTAAGVTRVLGQQSAPVQSAIRRTILGGNPAPVLFFPMDDGVDSEFSSSAIQGAANYFWASTVKYSTSDAPAGGAGSVDITNVASTTNPYTVTSFHNPGGTGDAFGVAAWVKGTSSGSLWYAPLIAVETDSANVPFWTLELADPSSGTGLSMMAENSDGTLRLEFILSHTGTFDDGNWHLVWATVQQINSTTVTVTGAVDNGTPFTYTQSTFDIGHITGIRFGPTPHLTAFHNVSSLLVSGVAIWNSATLPDLYDAGIGWAGETPNARLVRISAGNDLEFNTLGFYSTSAKMGAQENSDLMTIARSCETTEAGWLYDGLSGGLSFMAPSQRYDQVSQFTISASTSAPTGEVLPDFWPVQDDFARANQVTVTRTGGSSATYTDTTSRLGVPTIGTYPGNAPTNINYIDDSQLFNRAAWEVHKGTFFGFRWPTINVNVRKIPDRAAAIAGMTPGLMFTVFPLPTRYQAQYGADPLNLIAEGWSEFLTNLNWEIAFNCSMQDIYNVWKVGDSQLGRAGTGGLATLASDAAAGASTVSLATPTGTPLWTTSAGDFPLSILVDGIKVTLTAISGSSSPQTGTVDTVNTPIPRLIQSGQAVTIWKNGVIKL